MGITILSAVLVVAATLLSSLGRMIVLDATSDELTLLIDNEFHEAAASAYRWSSDKS
jgi:hypothetical protein